jgi:hypothetical protein
MEHDSGPGSAEPSEADEAVATAEAAATGEAAATEEQPATGEPRVDAALRRLGELDELPVSEHPGVYERIHEQLVEVLGELHSGQASGGQESAEQGAGPAGQRAG